MPQGGSGSGRGKDHYHKDDVCEEYDNPSGFNALGTLELPEPAVFTFDRSKIMRECLKNGIEPYEGLDSAQMVQIQLMARSIPIATVIHILSKGNKDVLNPLVMAEIEYYYEIGSRIGEYQIANALFEEARCGDTKAMFKYLELKSGWSPEGLGKSIEEEGKSPVNIVLNMPAAVVDEDG